MSSLRDRGSWVSIALSALGLCVSLGGAGCRSTSPIQRPYSPLTAEALLTPARQRARELRTLRAEAKVDHLARGRGSAGQRVKVRVTLLLGRGGLLRLEAENPLGGSLATLASNGERFAMLDVVENRFLVGRPGPCVIGRLLGIELPPDEIMDLLTGGAPALPATATVSWDPTRGGRERIEAGLPDGGGLRVWVDARSSHRDVVEVQRIDARGSVEWSVRHETFTDQAGVRLPGRTVLERPADRVDAIVKYRSAEPNVELAPSLFQLEPPPGLEARQIACD